MHSLVHAQSPVVVGMSNTDNVWRFAGPQHPVLVPSTTPMGPINHAVLLVGYGTHPTTQQPYWLVLNSNGAGWGDGGYGRLLRGPGDPWRVTEYVARARVASDD